MPAVLRVTWPTSWRSDRSHDKEVHRRSARCDGARPPAWRLRLAFQTRTPGVGVDVFPGEPAANAAGQPSVEGSEAMPSVITPAILAERVCRSLGIYASGSGTSKCGDIGQGGDWARPRGRWATPGNRQRDVAALAPRAPTTAKTAPRTEILGPPWPLSIWGGLAA